MGLLLVLLGLLGAACGGDDEEPANEAAEAPEETNGTEELDAPFGFELDPVGDSEVTGQVTVTPSGTDEVSVEVLLDEAGAAGERPVHIHEGDCQDLNPEPAFPLETVTDGESETTLDMNASELLDDDYAVNVHESGDDLETYVACGELPSKDEVLQGE